MKSLVCILTIFLLFTVYAAYAACIGEGVGCNIRESTNTNETLWSEEYSKIYAISRPECCDRCRAPESICTYFVYRIGSTDALANQTDQSICYLSSYVLNLATDLINDPTGYSLGTRNATS